MAEELRDFAPLRPLISRKPLAVLSDIDGTLSPIVSNPEEARVSERARAMLEALIPAGVKVALVTGRALAKAREMIDLPGAFYAANHGLDIFAEGRVETPEEVRPYVGLAKEVLGEISINIPGVVSEEKGPIVAFHYRQAASPADALAVIRMAIAASKTAKRFRVQEGRMVIELRPPLAIDKGTAARDLLARMAAGSAIALGDDATDIDMFRAVRESGLPNAVIAVQSEEATPEVMASADYFVRGVGGVERLLEELTAVV